MTSSSLLYTYMTQVLKSQFEEQMLSNLPVKILKKKKCLLQKIPRNGIQARNAIHLHTHRMRHELHMACSS